MIARIILLLSTLIFAHFQAIASVNGSSSFQVVVYNVENLFDIDGKSLYKDYEKEMYGMEELENKLDKICDVLRRIGGKEGPDIILFQEIEVDRTPDEYLSATEHLLKEMKIRGMGPYFFSLGYNPNDAPEKWPAVHCLTLSKFPITDSQLHPLLNARPILETTISVDGCQLTLFNNHWKSGASSAKMENFRLQNAKVLRERIDFLIKQNPKTDFIVGGDLNSHYNQSTVYIEEMQRTGINHILMSSEIEPAGIDINKKLYNLWHEIPPNKRGSDVWKGKWGTLMHILLPSNLYDNNGVNYVTDSFRVEKFTDLNEIPGLKIPFEWSNDLSGFGASDHFPLSALFKISNGKTEQGLSYPKTEIQQRIVNFDHAKKNAQNWRTSFLKPKNFGKTYKIQGIIGKKNPLTLFIDQREFGLYSYEQETRDLLFSTKTGSNFSSTGYLSRYRGKWQFIIATRDWIEKI